MRLAGQAPYLRAPFSSNVKPHTHTTGTMPSDPHRLLDLVKDEATFLAFVDALRLDKLDEEEKERVSPSSPYGPGANGWENQTVEAFLGAACAWGGATNVDLAQGLDPANPWKRFAVFLYCGKIYE